MQTAWREAEVMWGVTHGSPGLPLHTEAWPVTLSYQEGATQAPRHGHDRSGSQLLFASALPLMGQLLGLHCEGHTRMTMWAGAAGGHWDVLAFFLLLTLVDSA